MNEIEVLYNKAHEATKRKDLSQAYKYYEDINKIDPQSWEAKFCLTYYDAMKATEKDFWTSSVEVMNVERDIFNTLKKGYDKTKEASAVESIYKCISEISNKYTHDTRHHFANKDNNTRTAHISEYVSTLSVAAEMLYSCGDDIESCFGEKYYSFAVSAWKEAIATNSTYVKYVLNKSEHYKNIDRYTEKILKFDKSYERPEIELPSKSTSFTSRIKKFFKHLG